MFSTQLYKQSLAEYQRHHRLAKQDGLLNEQTYAHPGREMSDVETDLIALNDVKLKKLLYGVASTDVCGDWAIVAPIIPKEKFSGNGFYIITQIRESK